MEKRFNRELIYSRDDMRFKESFEKMVRKAEGLMEPTVEEQFGADVPDRTTLTLPLVDINHAVSGVGPEKGPEKVESKHDEIDRRLKDVFEIIKGDPGISRPQIMMKLNYTERQVRNSIDSLKREGYIHHEGPAKGGKWVVDKEYIQ